MYYQSMKTLVRPQPYSTIAISADRLISQKVVRNRKNKLINNKKNIAYIFLLLSCSVFLFLPESPKLSESICNKHNPDTVCNVW